MVEREQNNQLLTWLQTEFRIYQSGISTIPWLDSHSDLAVIKYEELGRASRDRGSVTAAF